MAIEDSNELYGVHDMSNGLHNSLQRYIEAQYHIRDDGLVQERSALLQSPGIIAQRAYVEATPVYLTEKGYRGLGIPKLAQDVLTEISNLGSQVGIYPTPYRHQVEALEAFLGPDRLDLVVATGTGSGKTESFLMPLLATLANESHERVESRDLPGCRAILLYPMNALVNDQVARIRRLLGNQQVNAIVAGARKRPIRFGSYTGRTSYPGKRTSAKDSQNIAPLFEEFYNKVEDDSPLRTKLEEMGRWPSKNLRAFYNESVATTVPVKNGKRVGKTNNVSNWKYRLLTQPDDRELMTRHEMQAKCPDVLVTNYSMLEYMLMRPIESPLFEQTAEWLSSNASNELVLILDEAHMYRGAGGAEVALLIRRLIARLGIPRDRVRCVLTSASLGKDDKAQLDIIEFAKDLTGVTSSSKRKFKIVTGTIEKRNGAAQATKIEFDALKSMNCEAVAKHVLNPNEATKEISRLAEKLGWKIPIDVSRMRDYLFENLTDFGPAELLINQISGNATAIGELVAIIFPSDAAIEGKERALDALLILCSIAKRSSDNRIFVPTRLHLFNRGLPGLYACINPKCNTKISKSKEVGILGKFHTKPAIACNCDDASRVYDFYTHRDCGAAFVRGWVDLSMNFVWHEPDIGFGHSQPPKLYPIDILVEANAHPTTRSREAWLHLQTGRLARSKPEQMDGFRNVWIPDKDIQAEHDMTFDSCPVCRKRTRQSRLDPSKIMDHITKGEAPFSTLVRAQIAHQPPVHIATPQSPNSGRKVLIFSDGRQKAARLARDMPRDMELDLFRQVVAKASIVLAEVGKETKPTDSVLYLGYLAVLSQNNLSMFDVDSAVIDSHVAKFVEDCDSDLEMAFENNHDAGTPPNRYKIALLKLLCGNYYSLSGTTVGFVEPAKVAHAKIKAKLKAAGIEIDDEELRALATCWIQGLLDDYSFDADLKTYVRDKATGFQKVDWSSKGGFEKAFRVALLSQVSKSEKEIADIEATFKATLTTGENGMFLNPNMIKLTFDLAKSWVRCVECTALTPFAYKALCTACGSNKIESLSPAQDHYLKARKSFWREPVETALTGATPLTNLYVEEHTAQLSNRDRKTVHSTTEVHELRFQDVLLNSKDRPIDVLSCTTTMEVGIDIGSLVAVAVRNVPPQRENYQQRGGRAGRRGSSVSSVVTFSQNGPHDSYYFTHPKAIVNGPPRSPELKIDNPKIAKRHVHSYLIQTYFQENMRLNGTSGANSSLLKKSLGETRRFFHDQTSTIPTLLGFKNWVVENVLSSPHKLRDDISSWIPENLDTTPHTIDSWVSLVSEQLIGYLENVKRQVPVPIHEVENEDDDSSDVPEITSDFDQEDLLDFLFFHTLLPSYAFPTRLCSFLVQKWATNPRGRPEIRTEQMPQQSSNQALSEYAPGRLIVINKKTYRSGGVFASTAPGDLNKAEKLFEAGKALIMCDACSFLQDPFSSKDDLTHCPVCSSKLKSELMIQPEVFGPENARSLDEDDREQEFTFASMAQFPQPTNGETFEFKKSGPHLKFAYAVNKRLLTLNKGAKGENSGFDVCKSCGCAAVHDNQNPKYGRHKRPYLAPGTSECNGEFETVFLGYSFTTDLLLLRFQIAEPLITELSTNSVVRTLESAAQSLAEALRLAASRHKQLDLDATEFGAGYRLLPGNDEGTVGLDVYLYDTLAGGAGYSELAAKYFEEIVQDTLGVLDGCSCDTSCTECLDHFHNQHLKKLLDRKLAASLLRYGLMGVLPKIAENEEQFRLLNGLAGLLKLDGSKCEHQYEENKFPLLVSANGKSIFVRAYPALMSPEKIGDISDKRAGKYLINENELRTNLPGVHAFVRNLLAI
jgi:ATP-dependent helicase YprA (DUF1998 family)